MNATHEQIEEILDGFNFDRVKKVMEFLDWRWQQHTRHIPTYNELRKAAQTMLRSVAHNDDMSEFSGGLKASNVGGHLSLEFVLSWMEVNLHAEPHSAETETVETPGNSDGNGR